MTYAVVALPNLKHTDLLPHEETTFGTEYPSEWPSLAPSVASFAVLTFEEG